MPARLQDRLGLPLSTSSAEALRRFEEGVAHLLAADGEAGPHFEAATRLDPSFSMAQFMLAREYLLQGNLSRARGPLLRTVATLAAATAREQAHVRVSLELFINNDERAFANARAHLERHPRDLVLLDVYTWARFFRSPGGKQAGVDYLESMRSHYGDDPLFLQMLGMAMADAGHGSARALLDPLVRTPPTASASALHAAAHLNAGTDQHGLGLALLEQAGLHRFHGGMREHLAFHEMLHRYELGQIARVRPWLDTYLSDEQRSFNPVDAGQVIHRALIYGVGPTLRVRGAGAGAHLVVRALSGQKPWARALGKSLRRLASWSEHSRLALVPLLAAGALGARRPPSGTMVVYAMLGAEVDGAAETVDEVQSILAERAVQSKEADVTFRAAEAVTTFARGDMATTIDRLAPLTQADLELLGGTWLEQQLVASTLLEAYVRTGDFDRASQMLEERARRSPPRGTALWWWTRVHLGRGSREEARASFLALEQDWGGADPDSAQASWLTRLRASVMVPSTEDA